ncbi:MAG: hypothetical protein ACRDTD_16480 [Pseudonocardiaceae bacterium]
MQREVGCQVGGVEQACGVASEQHIVAGAGVHGDRAGMPRGGDRDQGRDRRTPAAQRAITGQGEAVGALSAACGEGVDPGRGFREGVADRVAGGRVPGPHRPVVPGGGQQGAPVGAPSSIQAGQRAHSPDAAGVAGEGVTDRAPGGRVPVASGGEVVD